MEYSYCAPDYDNLCMFLGFVVENFALIIFIFVPILFLVLLPNVGFYILKLILKSILVIGIFIGVLYLFFSYRV